MEMLNRNARAARWVDTFLAAVVGFLVLWAIWGP